MSGPSPPAQQSLPPRASSSIAQSRLSALLPAAVCAGVICRLAQYAAHRSFWVDEAALLLNVRSHTFHQLFGALDYEQAAPPLFLCAERALLLILGPSELSLRLLPLLCGIIALILFAALARHLLDSPWDAFAVVMFAFSDRFIWHGTEVKQYNTDLCIALFLTYLALGPGERWSSSKRFLVIAVASCALAWLSYPTMFVFSAISLAMLPRGRGKGAPTLPWLIGNALAAASFLILIATVIHAQKTGGLTDYWNNEFLDLHRPWIWPWWIVRRMLSMANYAVVGAGPILLAAMIGGIVWLWRTRKFELLVILLGPFAITLAGALAHRYPFDGARLTTFLCGNLLLLATLGIRWPFRAIAAHTPKPAPRILAFLPTAYVLLIATASAGYHLISPRNRGHLRPVIAHVRQFAHRGDTLFVLDDKRAFLWYWPLPDDRARVHPAASQPAPAQRIWIIWSFSSPTGKRLADPVLRWAQSIGAKEDEVYSNGAGAVLVVAGPTPGPASPPIDAVFEVP